MSTKFYSILWILYFAVAGVLWLGGVMTPFAIVAFGFVAFGVVFTGMMCVLPGTVSHPETKKAKIPKPEKAIKPATEKSSKAVSGFSLYRSA